jgi:hypothetical protein
MTAAASFEVCPMAWSDEQLGSIALPKRALNIVMGFGSGLARRAGDPPGLIWAVGDRGPNLKVKTLVKRYGMEALRDLQAFPGAKVMPRLDLGPAIAKLQVHRDWVELLEVMRLSAADGSPLSGLPTLSGENALCEPAFDLAGTPLQPDPSGLDTEGIIACADGGFWVGDEFGPSLVRLDAQGQVLVRYVPQGVTLEGARYAVEPALPALASRRQLNRGFEAIAQSPDARWLYLAFQSPLAHPDEAAHAQARHVRLWTLDAATLQVLAQYLYPLDAPETFARDCADGPFDRSEIKVSELVCLAEDRLLVLERGALTTKIYRVALNDACRLAPEHLEPGTRPTIEQLSAGGDLGLPVLTKELVLSTDEVPQIGADLEGMVLLSPTELLLVNDNDFGVEGARTRFWKIDFKEQH